MNNLIENIHNKVYIYTLANPEPELIQMLKSM